jgi:hypothetical protein
MQWMITNKKGRRIDNCCDGPSYFVHVLHWQE